MMLFVFSTIVMYLGVRLYLMGIGKIKKEISNNDKKVYKRVGTIFFLVGLALTITESVLLILF